MRYDLNCLSWRFIACNFYAHGLWALHLCSGIALRTHKIKRIKISGFTFITWCPHKEISGIWKLKALKNTVLHMQARSWTGLESAVWKRGGCLQALCLRGDGSRPAGIKSESSHNWGKSVGNCTALAKTVSLCVLSTLCALSTRPGKKKNAKAKGQILTPALALLMVME